MVFRGRRGLPVNKIRGRYYVTSMRGLMSPMKLRRINEKLAFFLSYENIPFDTIESYGFIQFAKEAIGPTYQPPSASSIVRIIAQLSSRARKAVKKKLKNKKLVITSDLATVLHSTRGFLVLSASYFDNLEVKSISLSAKQLLCRHTADNIESTIDQILKQFNVEVANLSGATTDGGANIVCAMKRMVGEENHLICINHTLHNMVKRILKSLVPLKTCFDKLLRMIKHLKHSSVSMDIFRSHQMENPAISLSKVRYLKKGVKTRWNSEFQSAKTYLELHLHVEESTGRDGYEGPEHLTVGELVILEDYVHLTDSINEVTILLSGENMVIPCIMYMKKKTFRVKTKTDEGKSLKEALTKELDDLLDKVNKNVLYKIATFLDPRYKQEFMSITDGADTAELVNKELQNMEPIKRTFLPEDNEVYAYYGEVLQRKAAEVDTSTSHYHQELKNYKREPLQLANCDISKFWRVNRQKYPLLCKLSEKYLLIPASSVASERIVSSLNLVATHRRSRLTDTNIDNLVFLRGLDISIWKNILEMYPVENAEKFERSDLLNTF